MTISPVLPSSAARAPLRVSIVDDDRLVRQTLNRGLKAAGMICSSYMSGQDFLDSFSYNDPDCVILDMKMPGMSGLDVLEGLRASGRLVPVIFLTSHADIPLAVQAVRTGASDFLEKPVSIGALIEKIELVVGRQAADRTRERSIRSSRQRLEMLTPREREIADLVRAGYTSPQIAHRLELKTSTVHGHRARIMERLGAGSLAEMLRILGEADPI